MKSIFWIRRDLRLEDNSGLYYALKNSELVVPVFIFDKNILDELRDSSDARVTFIHDEILRLQDELESMGSSLVVHYGTPVDIFPEIIKRFGINKIFTNRDYEPYAKQRDAEIRNAIGPLGVEIEDFKDHVIFDRDEVVKADGTPYVVFTPYKKRWLQRLEEREAVGGGTGTFYLQSYPNEKYFKHFHQCEPMPIPTLEEMGFQRSNIEIPDREVSRELIQQYDQTRNFPAMDATSRLGIHFRFGTISIREKARRARQLNDTYLSELIWRDFYSQILDHFPHVAEAPFREKYGFIEWRNDKDDFEKWKSGRTGFPIVDAGMRQLNETGYMHNRVRMIVASFLTKHLLISWQWGEEYFAEKLLDFDLASNNGGWQWAAGSGTDAAPYFRIFNPESQIKKFDPKKEYIREWVPEYGTSDYPEPMVDHKEGRNRALEVYKESLAKAAAELG